jgi:hypothetical protein
MEKALRTALGTLALAAVFGAGWWANAAAQVPVVPFPSPRTASPGVISGADIGFQVERTVKGVPHGKIVVRVNGEWVEPAFTPSTRLLTQ